ncbi:hypothetical protein MTR_8g007190 [Medicago truncatula]|uniref:Uncharacterized protein n=1 Tax=Medicago truncatula TaxID=3880 RepID=A0A072TKE1_MEDTR|nr:hypothetical protein MTR_8g007190 [Medicago truncatula]
MFLAREGLVPKTEVERKIGAHERFSLLKDIFKEHLQKAHKAHKDGYIVEMQEKRDQSLRINFLYLFRYFRDLELVSDCIWGDAALAHLYKELIIMPSIICMLGISTLQGYRSRDAWCGYEDHQHPRTMMFLPVRGLAARYPYRGHLNQLDLPGVIISMYAEHRHICSFERVNLYSGRLRYEISYRYGHHLDHMLTGQDLGLAVMTGVESVHGYIRWFYSISHPRLILADEAVPMSKSQPSRRPLMRLVLSRRESMGT